MGASLLLAAGGRPENLSIFDPVSPPAESIRQLFVLVGAICAVILLLVEGVLLYSIVRFRTRPAPGPAAPAPEPPQVYGSRPIEIAWTAAPGLIVFLLLLIL